MLDAPPTPTRVPAPRDADRAALRRRSARRWRRFAPVAALAAIALVAAACAPPSNPGTPTGDVANAVNADRANSGLPGVGWDDQLYTLAQQHANDIAASQSLWHSDLSGLISSPYMYAWSSLGENLAEAPAGTSGSQIEAMWMGSGPHRANILNGGFNRIGVGWANAGGRVWVVALFGTR
jgi:uncharacterized protein YkwD